MTPPMTLSGSSLFNAAGGLGLFLLGMGMLNQLFLIIIREIYMLLGFLQILF